jgi:UDP-N-acetyl-D-galactosamine dehydrogenase
MNTNKIAVIGLGYVGFPLAIEFGKKFDTIGYDISKDRISELNNFIDKTNEVSSEEIKKTLNLNLSLSSDLNQLKKCTIYIITVPTPIDENKNPLLTPLLNASKEIGSLIKKNDLVIYESTVYPGLTEEECVPVLEKYSKLKYNKDFFVGYSPERINPGDKKHTLTKIKKITSGSNEATSNKVDLLYKSIIEAGTFKASSIKVAEAAKVIENSQRDINIAFVNELSKIFNILDINTNDVLEAAQTKWNFLPFKPGLVGGHCIGVDPYYLAQKAVKKGYYPEIILSGRRLNDSMAKYISGKVIKLMIRNSLKIKNSKILVLGFAFKENCPDFRNTKVIDVVNELKTYSTTVDVVDPKIDLNEANNEYSLKISDSISEKYKYDAIVLAVAHNDFKNIILKKYLNQNGVVYDVKSFFDKKLIDGSL